MKRARAISEDNPHGKRSPVNIPSVSGGDHQHEQLRVPDLAEDAVVAHPVAPQAREIGFESFSEAAGISVNGDPFVELGDDVALRGLSEFPEFLHSGRLIRLGQP